MHIITRTAISSQHLKGVGFIKNNLVKKWDIIILSEILLWEEGEKKKDHHKYYLVVAYIVYNVVFYIRVVMWSP